MAIILASQSPRRRELLGQMGLKEFRVLAPNVDEHADADLPAGELVEQLSRRKARAAALLAAPEDLVIAADTVVVLEGAVLGKPGDRAQAVAMLSALSGKEHQVYTGLTVRRGGREVTAHEVTQVSFRPLTAVEIEAYVDTGEPMDKAGAYGIQGLGAMLVQGIRGDYCNVVGLPVCRLALILREFGVEPLGKTAGE